MVDVDYDEWARQLRDWAFVDDDAREREDNGTLFCIDAVLEFLSEHECLSESGESVKEAFEKLYVKFEE